MPTTHESHSDSTTGNDVSAFTSGLAKTFSKGNIHALDHVNFTARFGEITALIGANGSGKSTLLKLLFGLLRPEAGVVRTLDLDPVRDSRKLRSQAGYVSQQQALDPEMTGCENLYFFCALYGLSGPTRRRRVEALVELFGLEDVIDRRVSQYSGGFRQRLHLAIGWIHKPRLLLLDEPTSGLDPQGQAFFWETMRLHVKDGHSVMVVTHDLEDVTRHAKQVALLNRGQICVDGPPHDIIAEHGTVVDVREEERLESASYPTEPPSLSSAYFHLTGQALDLAERGQGHKRRTKRP